ncbi:hypothetical protein [Haloarchaeobius sp. TZWWS8]|uniref:hypothetical protein n=1 Tax=Haloarchaeobius sp. TZWWS8 TaxID=3446121 RepID=UPI003EC0AED6
MRRRSLLSTLAAASLGGFAGCSALDVSGTETREPLEVDTTKEEKPTTQPFVRNVGDSSVPVTEPLVGPPRRLVILPPAQTPAGVDVQVGFSVRGNDERPTTIRLVYRNAGSETIEAEFGPTPPLSNYVAWDTKAKRRLFVVPVTDAEPTKGIRYDNCWEPNFRGIATPGEGTHEVRIPPGKAVVHDYAIVTPTDEPGCLPPGQYVVSSNSGWSFGLSVFDPRDNQPGESQFAGFEAPALPMDDSAEIRWYHEVERTDAIYTKPSTEQLGLHDRPLELTFQNWAGRAVTIEASTWNLYKLVDGRWRFIAPWARGGNVTTVWPGESRSVRLALSNGRRLPAADYRTGPEDEADFAVPGLGPGTYAVAYGRFKRNPSTEQSETVVPAVLLKLIGDAPTLTPVDVDRTETDGDSLHVYTTVENFGDVEAETTAPGGTVLAREQVMQFPVLRNTLYHLEDGSHSRVVLHTSQERVGQLRDRLSQLGVRPEGENVRFRYEGSGYRLRLG